MLRMNTPALSLDGVKAFAKTLRNRDPDDDLGTVANLLTDLVNFSPDNLIPLTRQHYQGLSNVAWVMGLAGHGKTELTRSIALLAMRNPKRRVVVLNDLYHQSEPDRWAEIGFTIVPPITPDNPKRSDELAQYTVLQATSLERSPEHHQIAFEQDAAFLAQTDLSETTLLIDRNNMSLGSVPEHVAQLIKRFRSSRNSNIVIASQDERSFLYRHSLNWRTDDFIALSDTMEGRKATFRSAACNKTFLIDTGAIYSPDYFEFYRTFAAAQRQTFSQFTDHLSGKLNTRFDCGSHIKALEVTSHWLGFRSWHALQGHLQKTQIAKNDQRPLTTTEVLKAIEVATDKPTDGGVDMWMGRTVTTLEMLESVGIDIRTANLFQVVLDNAQNPVVSQYLEQMPGYPNNLAKTEEQFGYCTMMAIAPSVFMYGSLE